MQRAGRFRPRTGVHLIMHDEIPANLYELRRGVADFVIGQDAVQQGALPLTLLADYIQLKQQPPKEFYHTDIRCCCGTISKICFNPGQEVLCLFRFQHFAVSD